MTELEKLSHEMVNLFQEYGMDRGVPEFHLKNSLEEFLTSNKDYRGLKNFKIKLGQFIFGTKSTIPLKIMVPKVFVERVKCFHAWEYDPITLKMFIHPDFDDIEMKIQMKYRKNIYQLQWFAKAFETNAWGKSEEKLFKAVIHQKNKKRLEFRRMFDPKGALTETIEKFEEDIKIFILRVGEKISLDEMTKEFHRIAEELYKCKLKERSYAQV